MSGVPKWTKRVWPPFKQPHFTLYEYGTAMGRIGNKLFRMKTYRVIQCNGCGEIQDLAYRAERALLLKYNGLMGYCSYTGKVETLHRLGNDIYCVPDPKQNIKFQVLDA